MASLDINIDDVSTELDDRWNDLSNLAINPGGANGVENEQRQGDIDRWQAKIILQQKAMDEVKALKQASLVTVRALSADEVTAMQAALQQIHVQIQKDQVWQNVINTATAVLGAANQIASTTKKA